MSLTPPILLLSGVSFLNQNLPLFQTHWFLFYPVVRDAISLLLLPFDTLHIIQGKYHSSILIIYYKL
jgi:hypothetical protein